MNKRVVFIISILLVISFCFAENMTCFASAPKSSTPRMIEVEEDLWVKQNEELQRLSDEVLDKEMKIKLLTAELDQVKNEMSVLKAGSGTKKTRLHKVVPGENLWKISNKVYKDPKKWLWIFKANEDTITDPNTLYPEQPLEIPEY